MGYDEVFYIQYIACFCHSTSLLKVLAFTAEVTLSWVHLSKDIDESLTKLAMYFHNWHMFCKYMNNIAC